MALIILRVLLFLLPAVAFIFWVNLRRRATGEGGLDAQAARVQERRLIVFTAVTVVAMLIVSFILSGRGGGAPNQIYIPPHMENGELVPGRFVDSNDVDAEKTER